MIKTILSNTFLNVMTEIKEHEVYKTNNDETELTYKSDSQKSLTLITRLMNLDLEKEIEFSIIMYKNTTIIQKIQKVVLEFSNI